MPLAAFCLRFIHGKYGGSDSPYKYFYSVLIYLSCIPGIFIFFIVFYLAVFQRYNILTLSIFTYFLPLISVFFTLIIIRKNVLFRHIPGFKRITGLFGYIICTFIILLILDRLRIFLFFHGSFLIFILIWAAIFIGLKLSTKKIFGYFRKR